jgi:hypothetical protein
MRRYWKLKEESLVCTLWRTHFEGVLDLSQDRLCGGGGGGGGRSGGGMLTQMTDSVKLTSNQLISYSVLEIDAFSVLLASPKVKS